MPHSHYRAVAQELLKQADVTIDGSRPWDIQVKDERFFARVLQQANLGLGESYMDGWWECAAIDEFFTHIFQAKLHQQVRGLSWHSLALAAASKLSNTQSVKRAFQIGQRHYDIGNDLYEAMLDKRLTYTCGYWKDASDLGSAQEAKLDLVCKKIGLKPGQHVLDIGCGWGSFAKFAAERYGARVTGVTVSQEQVKFGQKLCAGLPITLELKDYRKIEGSYDHVISLGMFEHVGYKNYRTYMEVVKRVLKPDGLFLLHTIGGSTSVHGMDPWMERYIFPNSMLPSLAQISRAVEKPFVVEDWHSFGAYYDRTLMAWSANVQRHWDELKTHYDERFYRMWQYYLRSCAGSFRARVNQLWQIVLSPNGVEGGYQSIR